MDSVKFSVLVVVISLFLPLQANTIRKYYQYRDSLVLTDSIKVLSVTKD